MIHSVTLQHCQPTEVVFIGLQSTPSAIAHLAARQPLVQVVEQKLVWCLSPPSQQQASSWEVLDVIAGYTTSPIIIVTESNVVIEQHFTQILCAITDEQTLSTSFPAILSPQLSSRLDERDLDHGEPFRSWGRIVIDSIIGQSQHGMRLVPIPPWWERLSIPGCREVSRTCFAMRRSSLDRLISIERDSSILSQRQILTEAGIHYRNVTHTVRHVQLTDQYSHVFTLVPQSQPKWVSVELTGLTAHPVVHRHRLN